MNSSGLANKEMICTCPNRYSVEPHGEGYALYFGRCAHRHGYNMANVEKDAAMPMLKVFLDRANNSLTVLDYVKVAIKLEPELPGEMPPEMFEAIKGDKEAITEALRLAVVQAKESILVKVDRLALATDDRNCSCVMCGKPMSNSELEFCSDECWNKFIQ